MRIDRWIVLIALLHIGFFLAEAVFWQTTSERLGAYVNGGAPGEGMPGRAMVRALLLNQGLYNAFLAAGLIWSVKRWGGLSATTGRHLAIFFLGCVAVAGFFGFFTVNHAPIFLVQALPASAVLAALLFRRGSADRPSQSHQVSRPVNR